METEAQDAKVIDMKATVKRPVEEIRTEYTQFCNSVGQIEYQMAVLKRDKEAILSRMSQLNIEAAEAAKDQTNG